MQYWRYNNSSNYSKTTEGPRRTCKRLWEPWTWVSIIHCDSSAAATAGAAVGTLGTRNTGRCVYQWDVTLCNIKSGIRGTRGWLNGSSSRSRVRSWRESNFRHRVLEHLQKQHVVPMLFGHGLIYIFRGRVLWSSWGHHSHFEKKK